MNWHKFDEGRTIGKVGSEDGIIIEDLQHIDGARITLESKSRIAPFAVTLGIYANMFHTHFEDKEQAARLYFDTTKEKIQKTIDHLKKENTDTDEWREIYSQLVQDFAD